MNNYHRSKIRDQNPAGSALEKEYPIESSQLKFMLEYGKDPRNTKIFGIENPELLSKREAAKMIESQLAQFAETSESYDRVKEFMRKAGQECPDKPCIPDLGVRKLRARVHLEEELETIDALGLSAMAVIRNEDGSVKYRIPIRIEDIELHPTGPADLVKIVDGCVDSRVVHQGTLIACGVKDAAVDLLVDVNNFEKFGPGGYRRQDGKWIKPPNHPTPDILGELIRQGWEGDKE